MLIEMKWQDTISHVVVVVFFFYLFTESSMFIIYFGIFMCLTSTEVVSTPRLSSKKILLIIQKCKHFNKWQHEWRWRIEIKRELWLNLNDDFLWFQWFEFILICIQDSRPFYHSKFKWWLEMGVNGMKWVEVNIEYSYEYEVFKGS